MGETKLADEPHNLLHVEGALAAINGEHLRASFPLRGGQALRTASGLCEDLGLISQGCDFPNNITDAKPSSFIDSLCIDAHFLEQTLQTAPQSMHLIDQV